MRHALLIRLTARLLMGWGLWVLVFQPMNTSYKLMVETGGNFVWGSFFAVVGLIGVMLCSKALPPGMVLWAGVVTASGWAGIACFFLVSVLEQDEFSFSLMNTGIYTYSIMFASTMISSIRYYWEFNNLPGRDHE